MCTPWSTCRPHWAQETVDPPWPRFSGRYRSTARALLELPHEPLGLDGGGGGVVHSLDSSRLRRAGSKVCRCSMASARAGAGTRQAPRRGSGGLPAGAVASAPPMPEAMLVVSSASPGGTGGFPSRRVAREAPAWIHKGIKLRTLKWSVRYTFDDSRTIKPKPFAFGRAGCWQPSTQRTPPNECPRPSNPDARDPMPAAEPTHRRHNRIHRFRPCLGTQRLTRAA